MKTSTRLGPRHVRRMDHFHLSRAPIMISAVRIHSDAFPVNNEIFTISTSASTATARLGHLLRFRNGRAAFCLTLQ